MLPPELFISIFALCAQDDSLSPYTLSRVCRHWREIVHSCPELWQNIRISHTSEPTWRRLAHLWLERAEPLKISLEMEIDDNVHILPILLPFLSGLSRVAKIKPGVDHNWVEIDSYRLKESSSTPVYLALTLLQADTEDVEPLYFSDTVTSCEIYISVRSYLLPHLAPGVQYPDSLRFLRLTEYNDFNTELEPPNILSFVSRFPKLEYFRFDGWCHPYEPYRPLAEPIALEQLRILTLQETCMARALLSEIYTPALKILSLCTLNIGFALDEYVSSIDGDSDDESNDPSQSPWSDHATGMGIRLWIRRTIQMTGRPPILERLAMHMSDFRTKDFRFVFEHLEMLEEFLITGSDMSDAVIGFFRPYTEQDPEDAGKTVMRVRLPRLRMAWFGECNLFTGDAVVEAFTERVRFTDGAWQKRFGEEVALHSSIMRFGADASNGTGGREPQGTLQVLGIGNCQQFLPRHEDAMREVLGKRFHTEHPEGGTVIS